MLTINNKKFVCDRSMDVHLSKVFEGEYEYRHFNMPPDLTSIIDIGANAGAFTIWAALSFPNATIYAYEPAADSYAYLLENVKTFGLGARVKTFNVAVGEREGEALLSDTENNTGDRSILATAKPGGTKVPVIAAASLPQADFVKLDCEGSEFLVIPALAYRPKYLTFEYHGDAAYNEILVPLLAPNYVRWAISAITPAVGVAKYVRIAPTNYISKK